jgi:hypothetical protein
MKYKEEQNMAMMFGSSVHSVLQSHAQKIMQNNGDLFREDIKKLLEVSQIPAIFMSDQEYVMKWMDTFRAVYDKYELIFNSQTFALENFIDKVYINDNMVATGKYDRLDYYPEENRITCIDYKTGKIEEQGFEMDFQYIIYSKYLLNKFQNEKIKEIRIIGFKNGYSSFTVPASDSNWQIILDWAGKIGQEKDYNPCQGRLCDWCGAKKMCPLFGGEDIRKKMQTPTVNIAPVVIPKIDIPPIQSKFKIKQIEKVETDACPECRKQIPITSMKCPLCGVEFESNGVAI